MKTLVCRRHSTLGSITSPWTHLGHQRDLLCVCARQEYIASYGHTCMTDGVLCHMTDTHSNRFATEIRDVRQSIGPIAT